MSQAAGTLAGGAVVLATGAAAIYQASQLSGPSVSAAPTLKDQIAASRFLSQATMGASQADIINVAQNGQAAWLAQQLTAPRDKRFWNYVTTLFNNNYITARYGDGHEDGFDEAVWNVLITSSDQLRQRVGLALLSQWVVGIDSVVDAGFAQFTMAAYLDILWDNALGNYRDLMEGVSTSYAMGVFLTYINNVKANPKNGAIPDENFARELMQLFTIGLHLLNQDGSPVLDLNGLPIPAYSQADVMNMARVWTGYVVNSAPQAPAGWIAPNATLWPNIDQSQCNAWRNQILQRGTPMGINENARDTGAIPDPAYNKLYGNLATPLLANFHIPAGTKAADARKITLDCLFNHQNVPPFVCKQLIQHLVTSNPSPGYISRVSAKFIDDGNGVRGDMKAVIKAILTDPEAQSGQSVDAKHRFGKLREPIVRLTQWARAFNAQPVPFTRIVLTPGTGSWRPGSGLGTYLPAPAPTPAGYYPKVGQPLTVTATEFQFGDESGWDAIGESPGRSPTVFNWFAPTYSPPGTVLSQQGLVAPEFQIVNEATVVSYVNRMEKLIGGNGVEPDYSSLLKLLPPLPGHGGQIRKPDLQAGVTSVVNALNLVLAANQLSQTTVAEIVSALTTMSARTQSDLNNIICAAVTLVMASPEYLVVR